MLNKYLEKILLVIIYVGSLAVVFVPLIIVPYSYFPYIIIKTIILRTIIEVVFLSWLVLMLYKKKYRPKLTTMFYVVTGFVLVWLVSTIFSSSFTKSFWGNSERMGGFFNFLHYYLWFVVLISVLKNIKHWYNLLLGSLIASILICIYSLGQRFGLSITFQSGLARVNGTIGNAAYLAAYTLVHSFIALYFFVESTVFYQRILYFLAFLLLLVVMFLTSTRGAALAFFIAVILFLIGAFIFKFYKEKNARPIIIFFSLIILFSLFTGIFKNFDIVTKNSYLNRFANASIGDTTVQTRLISWKAGTKTFRDNLLIGVGPENYNIGFNQYFHPDFYLYTGDEVWFDRAHNTLVDMMAMLGIFGIIGYLGIFALVFSIIWQFYRKQGYAVNMYILALLFIAYFLQNIFVFDSLNTFILFFMLLAFVDFLDSLNKDKVDTELKETKFSKLHPLIPIALVLVIFFSSFFGIQLKQTKANGYTYTGFLAQNEPVDASNPEVSFNKFYLNLNKAIDLDINPIDSINTLTQGFPGMAIKYKDKLDREVLNDAYLKTIELAEHALELDPKNVFNHFLLSKVYNSFAEFTRNPHYLNINIKLLEEAKELSPSRVRLYWSEAQTYLIAGEYEKAVAALDMSIELVEEISDPHWSKFLIYGNIGDFDKASKAAEQALYHNHTIPTSGDADNLISLFQDTDKYELLEKIYFSASHLKPNEFAYYERAFPVYQELILNSEESEYYKERALNVFNLGKENIVGEYNEQVSSYLEQIKLF